MVFDARFYLATYNDLRCAFIKPGIKTFDAAAQHWCDYGVKEGRKGIETEVKIGLTSECNVVTSLHISFKLALTLYFDLNDLYANIYLCVIFFYLCV